MRPILIASKQFSGVFMCSIVVADAVWRIRENAINRAIAHRRENIYTVGRDITLHDSPRR